MDVSELLREGFSRVHDHVHDIADGLSAAELATAPEDGSNPVGWLLWHLTRVQDHHVSELLEQPQVWDDAWAGRFGLAEGDPGDVGYGHSAEEVASVRPEGSTAITEYYDAVEARTLEMLGSLSEGSLDDVVDRRWDPPVTRGVRLVSILDDDIQHAGQAAYVKGILERR